MAAKMENQICLLCGQGEQNEIHLFQQCIVTMMAWVGSSWDVRIEYFFANSRQELVSMFLDHSKYLLNHQVPLEHFSSQGDTLKYSGSILNAYFLISQKWWILP
jgi:hypothetical protein